MSYTPVRKYFSTALHVDLNLLEDQPTSHPDQSSEMLLIALGCERKPVALITKYWRMRTGLPFNRMDTVDRKKYVV